MKLLTRIAISLTISACIVFGPNVLADFFAYLHLAAGIIIIPMSFLLPFLYEKKPESPVFKNLKTGATLNAISTASLVYAGYPVIAAFGAIVSIICYAVCFGLVSESEKTE